MHGQGLLGKWLRELQGPGVSGFPANAINSRHPNPTSLASEYSTSRTSATLVYVHPIPRSERGVSLHCPGDQQTALCGQRGPVPSLLRLTQACKFPFLQQSLFLNPCHGILSQILVPQVVPHRDSPGVKCLKETGHSGRGCHSPWGQAEQRESGRLPSSGCHRQIPGLSSRYLFLTGLEATGSRCRPVASVRQLPGL